MSYGKGFKHIIKGYSKNILFEKGKLAQENKNKIDAGDKETIKGILQEQKDKIIQEANQEKDLNKKQEINSKAESVQEIIDNLGEILNA